MMKRRARTNITEKSGARTNIISHKGLNQESCDQKTKLPNSTVGNIGIPQIPLRLVDKGENIPLSPPVSSNHLLLTCLGDLRIVISPPAPRIKPEDIGNVMASPRRCSNMPYNTVKP